MIRLRASERVVVVSEAECENCVFVVTAFPITDANGDSVNGGWLTITRATCAWSADGTTWRERLARAWRAFHGIPNSAVYVESADELRALRQAIHRAAQVAFPRVAAPVAAQPREVDG